VRSRRSALDGRHAVRIRQADECWFEEPAFISTSVPSTEQAEYRALVVGLATELYRRERGGLPPSEEALVGTFLPSLPDDGSPDPADELTPTVE